MSFYNKCWNDISEGCQCPYILENINPEEKKNYILVKADSRKITYEERIELEKTHKIHENYGVVHVMKAYDIESAKIDLVDNKKNDPLTRKKPSPNMLRKIKWKFDNRQFIKSEYDKEKLFTTFCLHYSNDLLPFSDNINKIIISYLINSDDINEMKCNLNFTDFNCFVNCKREDTPKLLENHSWLLRPSKIDCFEFYKLDGKLLPCSQFYALSIKKNNSIYHHLIEHSFGEGYYFCDGSYDNNGIPTVIRKCWYGSFVYALEILIKNDNIPILDYYKN